MSVGLLVVHQQFFLLVQLQIGQQLQVGQLLKLMARLNHLLYQLMMMIVQQLQVIVYNQVVYLVDLLQMVTHQQGQFQVQKQVVRQRLHILLPFVQRIMRDIQQIEHLQSPYHTELQEEDNLTNGQYIFIEGTRKVYKY